jgi:hypothetical protein
MRRPFIARGFGGDDVVAAVPPYYGTLAGARTTGVVDGPAVRRAHSARSVPRRRGSRRLSRGNASGGEA